MKQTVLLFLSLLFGIFFLPYLGTIFMNGPSACMTVRVPDLEDCLIWMVYLQEQEGIEEEAQKAEAVVARSNFYKELQEGMELTEKAKEIWEQAKEREIYWLPAKESERLVKAIDETKGEILTYQGNFSWIPYHYCSAGVTRDGEEAFYDSSYSYLQSVDSSQDRKAQEYLTAVYLDKEQFPVEMEVKSRDQAGYVTEMLIDGQFVPGEEFLQEMGLPSGNFSIQDLDETVRILCKGIGHGLGYSQYGGNVLATQGADYTEILNVYFPSINVENQEEFLKKM